MQDEKALPAHKLEGLINLAGEERAKEVEAAIADKAKEADDDGIEKKEETPTERKLSERELTEETGYRAQRLEKLTSFFAAPGILDEEMHLYLATGLAPGAPEREDEEEIENLIVSWDEALAMIQQGDIRDAKTIVGLLYYLRWPSAEGS